MRHDFKGALPIFRSLVLADVMTLANAGLGTLAIFLCLDHATHRGREHIWGVFILLPLALILDFLDGFLARKLNRRSVLGAEMDSLADIISFGLAPAVLGYTLGLRGMWDVVSLIFFVVCGIGRLARYNVTSIELSDDKGKVSHYVGTPIPTSMLIVVFLAVSFWQGRTGNFLPLGSLALGPGFFHPITALYIISGTAMISRIRIPKP